MQGVLTEEAQGLAQSCTVGSCEDIQEADSAIVQAIQSCEVIEKMARFIAANMERSPLLVVM